MQTVTLHVGLSCSLTYRPNACGEFAHGVKLVFEDSEVEGVKSFMLSSSSRGEIVFSKDADIPPSLVRYLAQNGIRALFQRPGATGRGEGHLTAVPIDKV